MMKSFKKYLFTLLIIGVNTCAFGQESRLQFADRQFELTNYRVAADEYAKYYSSNPSYHIAQKTASALDSIYAFSESYTWWKTAVSFSEATKLDFASLVRAGYRSIKDYQPSSDLSGSPYSEKDFEEFSTGTSSISKLIRISGLEAMDIFNTSYSDYSLSKGKTGLYFFSSNRGNEVVPKKAGIRLDVKGNGINKNYFNSDGKNYYQIYSSDRKEEPKAVDVVGFELYHLSDPILLTNGMMIFSGTPNKQTASDLIIYPGIFYGKFEAATNTVSEVKAFPYNQTNEYGVMSPSIDEERDRLYFASNRPGGKGGYDIYYVTVDDQMNFSEPSNLGAEINSTFNERDGYWYGNEFYFASDRTGGIGGLDIYSTVFQNNKFGEVSNLGKSVNSVADDFGFIKISSTEAYLSSDRIEGKGSDDLYALSWMKRRFEVLFGSGPRGQAGSGLQDGLGLNVYLEKNGNAGVLRPTGTSGIQDLSALEKAIPTDGKSDTDIISLLDNGKMIELKEKSGEELLPLFENGKSYTVTSKKSGHFPQADTFTFNDDLEELSINLVPIPFGLTIYDAIIYYDLDKDFLRDLSKEKLDEIFALMQKHPGIHLMIESHTDSRASDTYNQKLSERRAKSVIAYLEKKGVASNRIFASWFSESKLVNNCGDQATCPEPDHQLNRRSELRLVAFPDSSKSYLLPAGSSLSDFQTKEKAISWFMKK